IDSASSPSVITGRLIFLTMTALPESEAATSLLLNALFSKRRRMASATAEPSMIAPSTMLSGGTGWLANATTLKPLPTAFNSTALTALDPMSRPITDFDLPRPNTSYVLWIELGRGHLDRNYSSVGGAQEQGLPRTLRRRLLLSAEGRRPLTVPR